MDSTLTSLDVTLAYLKGKDAESEEAQEHATVNRLDGAYELSMIPGCTSASDSLGHQLCSRTLAPDYEQRPSREYRADTRQKWPAS